MHATGSRSISPQIIIWCCPGGHQGGSCQRRNPKMKTPEKYKLPNSYLQRVVRRFLKTGKVRRFHLVHLVKGPGGQEGYIAITKTEEWQRQIDEQQGRWN